MSIGEIGNATNTEAAAESNAANFIDSLIGGESPSIDTSTPVNDPSPVAAEPSAPRQALPQLFEDPSSDPQRLPPTNPASPTNRTQPESQLSQQPNIQPQAPAPQNTVALSPAIPPDLARAAQEFGFAPDQVNHWAGNPEGLRSYLNRFASSLIAPAPAPFPPQQFQPQQFGMPPMPPQGMQPWMQQNAQFQPQNQPQPGAVPQNPQQASLNRPGQANDLWDDKLKRELFEPEVADVLERIHQRATNAEAQLAQFQQAQAYAAQQSMMQQVLAQRHQAEIAASTEFDSALSQLPKEAEALFGRGSHAEVGRNTPFFQARSAVFNTFNALRQAANAQGLNPSTEVLVRQAAALAIPEQWNYISQFGASRQQTIHRPGRQTQQVGAPDEHQAEEAAAQQVEEFMRSKGEFVNGRSSRESLGLLS